MTGIINRMLLLAALSVPPALAARPKTVEARALETMKSATSFMMDKVSYNGGFVWYYLPDFSRQWGEMEAKRTMCWTQAPGTPQVGHLLLDAYHATGDEYYYKMAERVGNSLVWGQLECGGWNYIYDYAGEASLKDWYATIGRSGWRLEEYQHYYGNATYDDSCTSQCAKFLLRLYAEKFDPKWKPALDKAISFVLDSQYPNGGWPQRWPLMYDHVFRGMPDYSSFVTLNDDVIPDNIEFLIQCYQVLGTPGLREPILRAMYLVIVLQQGAPYSGWADQYTVEDLKPAHARSYEPRSVNTGTTVAMIRKMMEFYTLTGDTRFIAGIPAALDFLEGLKLPASEVARWGRPANDPDAILVPRFIDPETGAPIYVHREGSNWYNGHYFTNSDISNTIGHYSSAMWVNVGRLRAQYEKLAAAPVEELTAGSPLKEKGLVPLDRYYTSVRVEEDPAVAISSLTPEGCWLSPLRNTSNPYRPGASCVPSTETKYRSTNVGDEYDTSPYRNEDSSVMCISTQDYINKMWALIKLIDK